MKIRAVAWHADEWLAGTSQLGASEGWLYITIVNLIYSRGDDIEADRAWLGRVANMHGNAVNAALAKLIALGKVSEIDGKLVVKRCRNELDSAEKRVRKWEENGGNLGRPPIHSNGLDITPPSVPSRARETTNLNLSKEEKERSASADPKKAAPLREEAAEAKAELKYAWPVLAETGLPKGVPYEWIGETYRERPRVDGFKAGDAFSAYWTTGKGAGIKRTERGWHQAWRNWIAKERPLTDGSNWIDRYGWREATHGTPRAPPRLVARPNEAAHNEGR